MVKQGPAGIIAGEADVGDNVNVGCVVITCNYGGKGKYGTKIGANTFIGSNTNLVAPVAVGDNSYVASGSTITEDVPDDALAIARKRQIVKEHWFSRNGFEKGNDENSKKGSDDSSKKGE